MSTEPKEEPPVSLVMAHLRYGVQWLARFLLGILYSGALLLSRLALVGIELLLRFLGYSLWAWTPEQKRKRKLRLLEIVHPLLANPDPRARLYVRKLSRRIKRW